MSFIFPNPEKLTEFSKLLQKKELCYDDLDRVGIIKVRMDRKQNIITGFGLESFEEDALLRSVLVADSMQKNGIGTIAVEEAINTAKAMGVKKLYLLTTSAEKFFTKFGFEVIPRDSVPNSIANTNEFKTFCPDTAVCMKYKI